MPLYRMTEKDTTKGCISARTTEDSQALRYSLFKVPHNDFVVCIRGFISEIYKQTKLPFTFTFANRDRLSKSAGIFGSTQMAQ